MNAKWSGDLISHLSMLHLQNSYFSDVVKLNSFVIGAQCITAKEF